jgi:hypothetical protein
MPQLTLFDPGRTALTDEDRGRIVYTAGFVDPAPAGAPPAILDPPAA